jgi:hypothetical protein
LNEPAFQIWSAPPRDHETQFGRVARKPCQYSPERIISRCFLRSGSKRHESAVILGKTHYFLLTAASRNARSTISFGSVDTGPLLLALGVCADIAPLTTMLPTQNNNMNGRRISNPPLLTDSDT